jgi:hypothetical protein
MRRRTGLQMGGGWLRLRGLTDGHQKLKHWVGLSNVVVN